MKYAAILFIVWLISYAFLRAHGGKGLNIDAKLAPASTKKGKRDRLIGGGILVLMIGAILFVIASLGKYSVGTLIIPILCGAIIFMIANYIRLRNR